MASELWEHPAYDLGYLQGRTDEASTYVERGSLNVRWNDDGSLSCIHGDGTPCDLPTHTTVPLFVRAGDLTKPEEA